jgi:anthranilate phosphoribosyltransferase
VAELHDGIIRTWEVTPEEAGLPRTVDPAAFSGGNKTRNAAIFLDILAGREKGARLDLTLMNAGAGLFLGDKAASIAEGVELARELIRSGAALAKFEAFRVRTRTIEQH